ncbi:hypothetical protein D1007_10025 [Hordeum vulgare]|nr:hypothetical protein D1007_10025 [Hordeum vulgare]
MLQGLHEDFETIGTVLSDLVPLPSFDVALSRLDLKEKDLKTRREEKRHAVLLAHGNSSTGGDLRGDCAQQGGGSGGSLMSYYFSPSPSIGASDAICGLTGAQIVYTWGFFHDFDPWDESISRNEL